MVNKYFIHPLNIKNSSKYHNEYLFLTLYTFFYD